MRPVAAAAPALRPAAGVVVAAVCAMNALLVGTAVGAYGVSAMRWLPHLPLEWAALAVAAAAYVDSRSGPARFSEALRTVVLAALLVGAAAAAEVYLTPQ